ncbi:MAG: hypothetical protein ACKV2T_21890 [Kofleriaceae bacterium]
MEPLLQPAALTIENIPAGALDQETLLFHPELAQFAEPPIDVPATLLPPGVIPPPVRPREPTWFEMAKGLGNKVLNFVGGVTNGVDDANTARQSQLGDLVTEVPLTGAASTVADSIGVARSVHNAGKALAGEAKFDSGLALEGAYKALMLLFPPANQAMSQAEPVFKQNGLFNTQVIGALMQDWITGGPTQGIFPPGTSSKQMLPPRLAPGPFSWSDPDAALTAPTTMSPTLGPPSERPPLFAHLQQGPGLGERASGILESGIETVFGEKGLLNRGAETVFRGRDAFEATINGAMDSRLVKAMRAGEIPPTTLPPATSPPIGIPPDPSMIDVPGLGLVVPPTPVHSLDLSKLSPDFASTRPSPPMPNVAPVGGMSIDVPGVGQTPLFSSLDLPNGEMTPIASTNPQTLSPDLDALVPTHPPMHLGSAIVGGGGTGAALGLGTDLFRKFALGQDVGAGEMAKDTLLGGIEGAGTDVAQEFLQAGIVKTATPMLGAGAKLIGSVGSGGIVEGGLAGLKSTVSNAGAIERGEIDAAHATANVAVDTGIGFATGLAGAGAGAATGALIGSVFPGVGTAIGAGAGFVVGGLATAGLSMLVSASGIDMGAKTAIGDALSVVEDPLGVMWSGIGGTIDGVTNGAMIGGAGGAAMGALGTGLSGAALGFMAGGPLGALAGGLVGAGAGAVGGGLLGAGVGALPGAAFGMGAGVVEGLADWLLPTDEQDGDFS